MLPVYVETIHRVYQGLIAHCHLTGKRFFVKMHERTSQLQVTAEIIHPVYSGHCLALHAVIRVALQLDVYVRACVNDTLVYYSDRTHGIVNSIVAVFKQCHSAGCHYH